MPLAAGPDHGLHMSLLLALWLHTCGPHSAEGVWVLSLNSKDTLPQVCSPKG